MIDFLFSRKKNKITLERIERMILDCDHTNVAIIDDDPTMLLGFQEFMIDASISTFKTPLIFSKKQGKNINFYHCIISDFNFKGYTLDNIYMKKILGNFYGLFIIASHDIDIVQKSNRSYADYEIPKEPKKLISIIKDLKRI